jgi:recombination protein RecA
MAETKPKKVKCAGPDCNVMFVPKRKTAKFHTPACRLKAARAAGVDPDSGEVLEYDKPPKKLFGKPVIVDPSKVTTLAELEHRAAMKVKADRLGITLVEYERRLAGFVKMGIDEVAWISTGIPEFDALTQIPMGRLTQIEGRYGVGKTTLCLNMIRGLKDRKVLYIDSESSLNPELLMDLGLSNDKFDLYNKSAYLEDIYPVLRDGIKSANYDIIILDSVAMTTTKTREASDITSKDIGQKASTLNKIIELIIGDLRRSKTALVFINQTRDKIGGYVPGTYTPGGTGILYNASLMIELKTAKSWRFPTPKKGAKNHLFLGHEIEATITKSKVNTPWRTKRFKLYYPEPVAISEDEAKMSEIEAF